MRTGRDATNTSRHRAAWPLSRRKYDSPVKGVLWVALAEKAHAEANGAGFVTTNHVGKNSYTALNEGSSAWALRAITGKPAELTTTLDPSVIAATWEAGDLVTICTDTPTSSFIVPDHYDAVVG